MTITRVQGNAKGSATSGSTISITMSSTPTNGNVLILTCGVLSIAGRPFPTVSSISQTGVSWSQVKVGASSMYADSEIWFGVVGSGASKSITVNLSSSLGTQEAAIADVCEYSGLLTSNYLDQTANNSGGGTPCDSGTTPTTTQAIELWIASIAAINGSQSSPTNSFTLLDGSLLSGYGSEAYLEKIVSATGVADVKTTASGSGQYWSGCIVTLKGLVGAALGDGLTWITAKTDKHVPKLTPWTQRFPKFAPRVVA